MVPTTVQANSARRPRQRPCRPALWKASGFAFDTGELILFLKGEEGVGELRFGIEF